MKVTLESYTPRPLEALYAAFKRATTKEESDELLRKIETEKIPSDQILGFILRQSEIGHTSPWQMVSFKFAIEGVSRALTHQLVRHHVGTDYEQQSQRYVKFKTVPVVTPPSFASKPQVRLAYEQLTEQATSFYELCLDDGIPAEDARYGLLTGTESKLIMQANMAALLHMADLRLCTQAQWEIRDLFKLIRKAIIEVEPVLGNLLAPKCAAHRGSLCDESYDAWLNCPLGFGSGSVVRPHKSQFKRNADVEYV